MELQNAIHTGDKPFYTESFFFAFRIAALKGNPEIADLLLNSKGTECDVNFIDKETGLCTHLQKHALVNMMQFFP